MQIKTRKAPLWAGFLLLLLVSMSSGVLPKYPDRFSSEPMELAENGENDTDFEKKGEKKYSETDDYLKVVFDHSLWRAEEVPGLFAVSVYVEYNFYIDILTPPPEQG
ncbi:MAG: hypothetical protein IPL49_12430 [Saprospirales bacterium]|nr:hypothetical protein [Saprospirales bacterium]MBK8491657.1 hypothetical protein [Saprospirales bacterium]